VEWSLIVTLVVAGFASLTLFALLHFRYGDKVVALVMNKLSFRVHAVAATLLATLTGFCIGPLGFRVVVEFLEYLLSSTLLAAFTTLTLLGFLLGIHLHNIAYYSKRFEEVYRGYSRTRKDSLKRSAPLLSFLATVTPQIAIYIVYRFLLR